MRKITNLLIAITAGIGTLHAGVVTQNAAQTVATNFYGQTFKTTVNTVTLAYTEKDITGTVSYYVFNINAKDGFVIVSAEDVGHPIIGYNGKGQYITPAANSNFDFWMQKRNKEIGHIRALHLTATVDITNEWTAYTNNIIPNNTHKPKPHKITSLFPSSSAYLVQSTWDQPAPYNDDCPTGSGGTAVTGCVATAMSQIMRYWSYPAVGTGSSSYNGGTYGPLSANYSHPYRWSNMPLTGPSSSDTDMARLLSDAGISVEMSYSPSGSGAYVITLDDASACAQISYVKYFNYSPSIISGENVYANMTDWQDTLENELDHSRPIQYVGDDPSAGGHTWVCDGYDASNNFHMNWGWSAADDGLYSLSDLNPGSYDFSSNMEALMGIVPPGLLANFSASPTSACIGATINFTDQSVGQSIPTSWKWRFGDGSTSTLQNPSHTYTAAGTYNVTEVIADGSGHSDSVTKVGFITIQPSTGSALPLVQGFEATTFPPAGWTINNPDGHSSLWGQTNECSGFAKSKQCMFYNNCSGGTPGEYDQVYTATYNFTSIPNPTMYFDVAYEPQSAVNSDTLVIYYSLDCGATWNKVYSKGGATLCTTGGVYPNIDAGSGEFCFVPAANHWRTDTIKMAAIAGKNDVMFSFENRSGNGVNIYVDNLNIPGLPTSTINLQAATSKATVYPNPNNGSFTVDLSNIQDKQQMVIYNVLGQNVYSTVLDQDKTQVSFTQTPGVYFYRILSLEGKMLSEGKLVVK